MCASAVRLLFISVLYNKKGDPSFEESPFYSGKTGIRTNDYNVQYINHVWSSVKSL